MNNLDLPQISGICLVNKPSGVTSHDVVNKARKLFNTKSIGHTGTLDPLATGLLILTIGNANKLSDYLMDGDKGYEAEIKIGIETNSQDRTGEILFEKDFSNISQRDLESEILGLSGNLKLKVPSFSAVKINGKKLYELARKNKDVPVIHREMTFNEIKILKTDIPFVTVSFRCSKGAYVRAWVQELGQRLGSGATLWSLIRTYNAPYELSQSISFDDKTRAEILNSPSFIPFEKILPHWPRLSVNEKELRLLKNGALAHSLEKKALRIIQGLPELPAGVFIVNQEENEILSFLEIVSPFQVKIKKVFVK